MNTLKTYIISALLLTITAIGATAQNEFYQKYSEKPGVTKVYISKTLFSLMNTMNGMDVNIGDSGLDVGKISKDLTGLYVLTTSDPSIVNDMEADFKDILQKYDLELLMEVNDDQDEVKMYITRDGNYITNFFMHSRDSSGELAIIYLEGKIQEEDLMSGMKK